MRYLLAILLFFSYQNTFSQIVRGSVSDISGTPLEGVSIYIEEEKQGIITDTKGSFQLLLEEGTYNFTYLLPEYQRRSQNIIISDNDTVSINIILERQELHHKKQYDSIDLKREIVAESKKHFFSDQSYTATSYIKGQMVIKEVSDFIDKIRMKVEKKKLSDLKNAIIKQEIYALIDNISTDSTHASIIAHKGELSKDWSSYGIFDYLASSLYQKKFNGKVSPLNGGSSYYTFLYKGSYFEDKEEINKIEVKAKIKDADLINGFLYFDNSWELHYADLIVLNKGIRQNIQICYYDVYGNNRLPITTSTFSTLDLLGTKVDARYDASLTYRHKYTKETNDNILEQATSFLPQNKSRFWEGVRTQETNDSIYNKIVIPQRDKYKPSNYWLGKILFGNYAFGSDTTKWNMKYGGVKMVFRDYNYVDGFWLGQRFEITGNIERNKKLTITPHLYYLTARHRLAGGTDAVLQYNRRRNGKLAFSIASRSTDFNSLSITRYQNYFTSLFFGENGNFFYQKDYISIGNEININKKLRLSAAVGTERRHGLSNHTNFTLINKNKIKPNIFPDDRFDHTYYSVELSYSPIKEFTTSDALEIYKKGITPIFNIEYQEGFSSWQTNNSKYRKLKGGIIYNLPINYFNKIDLKIEGGVFLNNRNTHFADYQHFGASDMLVNLNSLFDSFLLLENYELQTDRYWVNAFLNYSGKYFLLKRIPFLQRMPFYENIHIKTLFTPDIDSYTEFGYSVSFTRYIGIGTFASFNNVQGKRFGVRLSLNLSSLGL